MRLFLILAFIGFTSLCRADEPLQFNRDIQPILADKCFHCHGPDSQNREAGLRLDQEASAKEDRQPFAAVTPGKPDESELIRRIVSDEPGVQMPPAYSNRSLTAEEKDRLRRWIAQGAVWQRHWSFVPPTRPALPSVTDARWPRNAIDRFILARLDEEGLSPSPQAAKTTLLRRVTLELTGLPPTVAETEAFLADDSPDALERRVDKLLASVRYGEHQAVMWLDAARYADTDGYQNDGPRSMWRWRDWVIDAYNCGMPFDRFTIEQLAGDLLPDAALDQRIATGFNRNHRYNSEAGLVLEEFLLENAVDRVDTTAAVWMGLTLGCARCHDHKYDPFSQKEYYQLISFFDNITESGRAVKFGNSEPWAVAPTDFQQEALERHDRKVEAAKQALVDARPEIARALEACREQTAESAPPLNRRGLSHHFALDGDDKRVKVERGRPVFRQGMFGNAATVGGQGVFTLGEAGDVQGQKRASIAFWLRPEEISRGVILSRQASNTRRPGFAVELRDGRLQFYIITRWLAGVGAVQTVEKLSAGEWVHVCLTNDGSQSARGMSVYLDGRKVETRILHNTNSNTGGTNKGSLLRIGGGVHGPRFTGQVDDLRFYRRTLYDDEISLLAAPHSVESIVAMPASKRTPAQQEKLAAWFLEHAAPANLKKLASDYHAARAARQDYFDTLPTTMVMEERSSKAPTPVRIRGEYHRHGDEVASATPEVFPAMRDEAPRNRLGLARWLVSGEHPLTARVSANRIWQFHFGAGLVKTAEDFGTQGEPPSHPQLLDWLAVEFVETGWDVKRLHRSMVSSAAYRQSSAVTPEMSRLDPHNRLLARGVRRRLPARVIRDQALAVSGLLEGRVGGPSVSPYQPANLWKEMSNMTYRQSKGADLYRRGLYTLWKRTVAPPSLAVLDAADRETCALRPKRTNTPLQALTLLNETSFVECARHLAVRMLTEGGSAPIDYGFRLVTAREVDDEERTLLQSALEEYRQEYRQNPDAAAKLVGVGESPPPKLDAVEAAAYTALANVLLNMDEALTRE